MSNKDYKPILSRANRLELFTRQECETILKAVLEDQSQRGSLTEFKVVPAIENIGFLGEYYHLILDYQLEAETGQQTTRLFVKSLKYENDNNVYDLYLSIQMKEAKLYSLLLNELKQFCKYNQFDDHSLK